MFFRTMMMLLSVIYIDGVSCRDSHMNKNDVDHEHKGKGL